MDVVTGEWLETRLDIEIPGALPLRLRRVYASAAATAGYSLFGPRWSDSLTMHLRVEDAHSLSLWDEEGCGWVFSTPYETLNATHLGQPDWHLRGTRSAPILDDLRSGIQTHFQWIGQDQRQRARISHLQDAYGNRAIFHYAAEQLLRIEHSAGYALIFSYSAHQLAITLQEQASTAVELVRYTFDAQQRLVRSDSEFSGRLEYAYDAQHRAIAWGDGDHTQVQLRYNSAGQVCQVAGPQGIHSATFEYDHAQGITRVLENAQLTQYHYNQDQLLTQRINPLGQQWHTEWNAQQQKCSETDPRGRRTDFFYTNLGQLSAVHEGGVEVQRWEWDEAGRCTAIHSQDGQKWSWEYNQQGNVVAAHSPSGSQYFTYDSKGCLQTHTANDIRTHFAYDAWQRPCAATAANGAITRWQQSRLGRMTERIDGQGQITRFEYAGYGPQQPPVKGRHRYPTAVVLPNGERMTYRFDQQGLLSAQGSAAGNLQTYEWGAFDLLRSHTDATGATYSYHYDHHARLRQVSNPMGQHWSWEYDAAGQLTREIDFAGRETCWSYDVCGRLIGKTAADWTSTRYTWDQHERLSQIESGDCTIAYTWDSAHRLSQAKVVRAGVQESAVVWVYDKAGRVICSLQDEQALAWHYQQQGQLSHRSTPQTQSNYRHDALGMLAALSTPGGELYIERDALGQEIRRSSLAPHAWQAIASGAAAFVPHFHLQQQFDCVGRLQDQALAFQMPNYLRAHASTNSPADLAEQSAYRNPLRHYRWQRGSLAGIDEPHFGSVNYQRDSREQIIRTDYQAGANCVTDPATTLVQETFAYNALADISWQEQVSVAQLHAAGAPHTQRQTYQSNTVSQSGQLCYRHDACGRMVERTELRPGFRPQTTTFTWDGFDRLIQVHTGDGAIWRYTYDALGRRTSKRCLKTAKGAASQACAQQSAKQLVQEIYLWDAATLAEQTKHYADGSQEHLTWHYAPGSFTPLAVTWQGQQTAPQLLYIVSDHLGTPRELVNAQGQIVWATQWQTWGKRNQWWPRPAANDSTTCPEVDLRFANQWYDAETGLHYNYQRYYDPDTGQYCSPDPIGIQGGLRPQGYVHDPSGWVDPLGLAGCSRVQEVQELFNKTHARNHIEIDGKLITEAPNNGNAKIFSGVSEAQVKQYFQELAGINQLPAPRVIQGKGNLYSVNVPGGNFNLRDFSSSASLTGPAWTVDIPKSVAGTTYNPEIKFLK